MGTNYTGTTAFDAGFLGIIGLIAGYKRTDSAQTIASAIWEAEVLAVLAGGGGPAAAGPPVPTGPFKLRFGSEDSFFDFPGGSFDPGELPTDHAASLQVRDAAGNALATITGFSLDIGQLADATTTAQVMQLLFSGDDNILGGGVVDRIFGLAGNDTVSGRGGNDIVYGGIGNDTLNGDAGNDFLFGETGLDNLFGGAGNDTESGGIGNDRISGGDGNDILRGDAGNDRITGGFGRDTLTGGAGLDVFAYQTLSKFNGLESGITTATRDVITDFKHGQDKIDPSFILVPKFKFLGTAPLTGLGQIHYKFVGNDTLVEISTDADAASELSILLKGHVVLTASDFVL